MAVSTQTQASALAIPGTIRTVCPSSIYVSLSTLEFSGIMTTQASTSGTANAMGIPGAIRSTIVGDTFRFPIRYDNSKMLFYIIADAMASSSQYMTIALHKPSKSLTPTTTNVNEYSPAWGVAYEGGASSDNTGWAVYRSTSKMQVLTSECEAFVAGPFESNKFALNFGPTSTAGIDKGQNYFECMFGLSSVASTGTWTNLTTNAFGTGEGSLYVIPIEIK